MKKITLLAFLLIPIALYSQEISEAYLESLPESVKNDVLKGIDDRDESEQPVIEDHPPWLKNKILNMLNIKIL